MMAYDAESDQVILFGGFRYDGLCCFLWQRDTWSYDFVSNTWRKMRPSTSPSKDGGPMAYDAESDRVILFFGALSEKGDVFVNDPASETWVYDTEANIWTEMDSSEGPFGIYGAKMAYDVESDRMILFGGWDPDNLAGGGGINDTWTYDYNTNTWIKMQPEISPPGRYHHAMAYDAESDRVILWGGRGPVPVEVSSVWAYDYNANVWEELESSGAPSPIGYAAMVYATSVDRSILYAEQELWAFDYNTNTWTLLSDAALPGELTHHTMAYNTEADRVILFVGESKTGFTNKPWVYDPTDKTWTEVTRRPQ
jgi:N-acetylneuraminic acid mutarotase